MNGQYTVRTRTPAGTAAWVGLVFFLALTGLFAWLNATGGTESMSPVMLEYGVSLGFALLCLYVIYLERRPRVTVSGDELTCCPRWKRSRTVHISEITSRRSVSVSTPPVRDPSGGPGFYSTSRLEISYFIGEEELIRINSRMENAGRLDSAVERELRKKESGGAQ